MTKDRKILYAVSMSFSLLLLLSLFIPDSFGRVPLALILLVCAVAVCALVRKREAHSINKGQVLLIMLTVALLYLMLYYLTGINFGFSQSAIRLTSYNLFAHVIPIAVSIITVEIIRCVLMAQGSRVAYVFCYVGCVCAELAMTVSILSIGSFNRFMDAVGMTLIPALVSNAVYAYIVKRYGIYPNIVYRLITALYVYFIPYVPNAPDFIMAVTKLFVPLIIFAFIDMLFEKKRKYAIKRKNALYYVGIALTTLIIISAVMLISCKFRFGILVIGSDSMSDEINLGDAVIYEQYDGQIVTEGQVIVFDKNGTTLVHRVADIERINGENRYYTKGDANPENDSGYITEANIVGVVNLKLSYVGYPTVWIRKVFSTVNGGD